MQTERLYLKLHAYSPNERPMNEWSHQRVHKWRVRGDWSGEVSAEGIVCPAVPGKLWRRRWVGKWLSSAHTRAIL